MKERAFIIRINGTSTLKYFYIAHGYSSTIPLITIKQPKVIKNVGITFLLQR